MEKCPRSGTSIRYLGSLCACVRVYMHVCVCKSVSKRTFISSSDIITLPQVEGGYQALTPPFSILIIHLLHPPFFFSLPSISFPSQESQSDSATFGSHYGINLFPDYGSLPRRPGRALPFFASPPTAHSSWCNQPAALLAAACSATSGEITSHFSSLYPKY